MHLKKHLPGFFLLIFGFILFQRCIPSDNTANQGPTFSISFEDTASTTPLDGRLLLMLSTNKEAEPRFQIEDGPNTQLIFGIDIEGLNPGDATQIDESAFGYPIQSLSNVPADEYNACFAACPDPIDFRAYTVVDIYKDKNAYFLESEFKKTPRPGQRDYLGHVNATLEEMNHRELALGTHSRSGEQWDIWQAVYSPTGDNGYPQPIWDKLTGEIDPEVAEYWKENYDLRYILERDWDQLGTKLQGKIHIYCGDMDNYYLNNAVMLMEDFLENTRDPYYAGEVAYGDGAEHCWNGDPELPNAISRLRYNTMYLPKILKRIEETAPKGTDLTSWRY